MTRDITYKMNAGLYMCLVARAMHVQPLVSACAGLCVHVCPCVSVVPKMVLRHP